MVEQVTKKEIQSPKDGRWYHTIHRPVLDKKNQLLERQVVLYDITERKQALMDLEEREEYLRKENILLKSASSGRYKLGEIIGKSAPMQEVYETILHAATSDASVIIYGESGTGKELVARAIHNYSDRKDKGLVYVNCGAIPESLIESETGSIPVGLVVDAVSEVLAVDDEQIEEHGTLGTLLENNYISGLATFDGNVKILLDIQGVFDVNNLVAYDKAA